MNQNTTSNLKVILLTVLITVLTATIIGVFLYTTMSAELEEENILNQQEQALLDSSKLLNRGYQEQLANSDSEESKEDEGEENTEGNTRENPEPEEKIEVDEEDDYPSPKTDEAITQVDNSANSMNYYGSTKNEAILASLKSFLDPIKQQAEQDGHPLQIRNFLESNNNSKVYFEILKHVGQTPVPDKPGVFKINTITTVYSYDKSTNQTSEIFSIYYENHNLRILGLAGNKLIVLKELVDYSATCTSVWTHPDTLPLFTINLNNPKELVLYTPPQSLIDSEKTIEEDCMCALTGTC